MTDSKYAQYYKGKNCIVTGASSGIGRLLANRLVEYGANLLLTSRREQTLHEVVKECQETVLNVNKMSDSDSVLDPKIELYSADVSDLESSIKVITFALEKFGYIDILVANAGASMHDSIENTSELVFQKMMQSNYYAAINIIIPALSSIKERKGTITAVTSIQSLIGVPNHAAYVAAKHALAGFLETLEMEEPDINIIEIITGWVSGTDIRNHAVDGKGNIVLTRHEHQRHSRSSITVEECVDSILAGMLKKQRLVFRPLFWRNILFVKYSMRKYLHHLITSRQNFSSS